MSIERLWTILLVNLDILHKGDKMKKRTTIKELKWDVYNTLKNLETCKRCYYKFNTVMFKGNNWFKVVFGKDSVDVFLTKIIERRGNTLRIRKYPIAIVPYDKKLITGAVKEIIKIEKSGFALEKES